MKSKLFINLDTAKTTGCLSYEDVKTIIEQGFIIGGHTINHCNLAELRSDAQVRHEIIEDKMRLERISGGNIRYFAYPFGAFYNPAIDLYKIVEESGYIGAVTTIPDFNDIRSNLYMLHRDLTSATMNFWTFKAKVYGNYDATRLLNNWLKGFSRGDESLG